MPIKNPTVVWSCGGGTQSAAIAGLIISGKLPKPDRSIIIDTEREKSTTWEYLDTVIRPALLEVGVEIERVPKSQYATVDLYAHNGDLLLPVYTKTGKLPTFCSNEWKQRVVMRHLRATGIKQCKYWVGISTDEMKRIRTAIVNWFQPHYPLVYDVPMNREQCIEFIDSLGWPKPPRSSCWMCPNMRDEEWQDLSPDDLQKAIELERQIQEKDPEMFLHPARVPIDQVDFKAIKKNKTDNDGCQTGMCFT